MSQGAIIGGVVFLMLIVIGVVMFFMMGGDGDSTTTPTGPAPVPGPAPGSVTFVVPTATDNFTSSYDDMSGPYSDISTDVPGCKIACQNKGDACGGFMHKDDVCRMYEDGSSTGVDIQNSGWTAYRK